MSLDATTFVERPRRTRAALSNGSLLPPGVDGRSSSARRWKDLVEEFSQELGGELSAAEVILVKQCALVALRVEQLQADAVSGAEINDSDIVRYSNATARLFTALAKQRASKPKSAVPSIAEHFAKKRAAAS
jgi:hypothetical protein